MTGVQTCALPIFAIIENPGHGNFVIGRFHTRHPSETSLCTVAPFPTDTSSPIFFLRGRGGGGVGLSVLKITKKTLIHMLMQLNEAEYHLKNYGGRGGC